MRARVFTVDIDFIGWLDGVEPWWRERETIKLVARLAWQLPSGGAHPEVRVPIVRAMTAELPTGEFVLVVGDETAMAGVDEFHPAPPLWPRRLGIPRQRLPWCSR